MTPIAPFMSKFLRVYLPKERGFSPNTCDTYAYAFKLLFLFASKRIGKRPSAINFEEVDSALVLDFLADLETTRKCSASSRNARLAAIKTFMKFVEFELPSAHEQSRKIQLISSKRHDEQLIRHLTMDEIRPILNAPDTSKRLGIRDRAMLHLCFSAGLRVSELVELKLESVSLQGQVVVHVIGKGRRERSLPMWDQTAKDLRAWLALRGNVAATELFVNADGTAMTRAGFEYILDKYAKLAAEKVSSLKGGTITPHQLRHSCAVLMLQATRDIRKVSLWLGHAEISTTQIYLKIDPSEKLEAMEAVVPPELRRGKFKAPDALISSLLA